MSHNSVIEHEIINLNALKLACKLLGLQFMEGQRTYKWYGQFMGDYPIPDGLTKEDLGKCLHAIKVPGAKYEIGIISTEEGYYQLLWDFWSGGGLKQVLGANAWRLVHAYIKIQTALAAKENHKSIEQFEMPDRTRLVVNM